ncbi:glycosyltransferase family 8 protein [Sphingomonas parva]|uniref:Glycosyltransferase family 8 protein n=1 Tax=Sphingomonas parva TaxID=2555898 RepID=A0A4Y8ZYY7_9SPHN|nr:glycosyltransferase family 8 protein [Sphingomonas parva]TFI60259.1 glycosyltransferase family 8 protein [Sphingomonas parva]
MAGPIDVAFCFDDHLALPGAIAILSLLESRREDVRLHVLTDPRLAAAPLLRTIAGRHGVSLRIIDAAPESRETLDATSAYGLPSLATYRRIFLGELLPDLDRILYLDADVLVRRCLSALWTLPLDGRTLAAVPDPWMITLPAVRAEFPDGYFNAGVLLLDLERCRTERLSARCLGEIRRRQEEAAARGATALSYSNEQTPLNACLRDDWKALPPLWNFTGLHGPRLAGLLGIPGGELAAISADPAVVHFLGAYKPWLDGVEGLSPWHVAYQAWRDRLEREYGTGGLAWPGAFTNGAAAVRARRLMALRLVHAARTRGMAHPAVVLTGLLGREIAIVAAEQGLSLSCFASDNPLFSGGSLDGIPIVSIAEAVAAGCSEFILGDYRRLDWSKAGVRAAARDAPGLLHMVALDGESRFRPCGSASASPGPALPA